MRDPLTAYAARLPLPRRRTEREGNTTRSYVPGITRAAEIDQPWIVYTYGRVHDGWWPLWRSSRILGRAVVGMECAICGEQRVAAVKMPRFAEIPDRGKHPERLRFLLDHLHPDRPHPMSWARPLLNLSAHTDGLDLDLLAMRLQADLDREADDA